MGCENETVCRHLARSEMTQTGCISSEQQYWLLDELRRAEEDGVVFKVVLNPIPITDM